MEYIFNTHLQYLVEKIIEYVFRSLCTASEKVFGENYSTYTRMIIIISAEYVSVVNYYQGDETLNLIPVNAAQGKVEIVQIESKNLEPANLVYK